MFHTNITFYYIFIQDISVTYPRSVKDDNFLKIKNKSHISVQKGQFLCYIINKNNINSCFTRKYV